MTIHDYDTFTDVFGARQAQSIVDNRDDYDAIDPYETEEQWIIRALGLG